MDYYLDKHLKCKPLLFISKNMILNKKPTNIKNKYIFQLFLAEYYKRTIYKDHLQINKNLQFLNSPLNFLIICLNTLYHSFSILFSQFLHRFLSIPRKRLQPDLVQLFTLGPIRFSPLNDFISISDFHFKSFQRDFFNFKFYFLIFMLRESFHTSLIEIFFY